VLGFRLGKQVDFLVAKLLIVSRISVGGPTK